MRRRIFLLGLAIPLVLTATVFAVPSGGIALPDTLDAVLSGKSAEATSGNVHDIQMTAVELANSQMAYKMIEHTVTDADNETEDITSNYSADASIPGPVIVIAEGDTVHLTIFNDIDSAPDQQVSVHVHGVHYEIDSDGTLEHINQIGDQGAYPEGSGNLPTSYTYTWVAAPGTAGTWPYHDHNWGGLNGAEHRGLFGAVIVNPADGEVEATDGNNVNTVSIDDISKDFILYMGDDAFWGTEITPDGQQTPLWVNPTLVAAKGDNVRFHLIALGTDMHQFKMANYNWVDPGTSNLINMKEIGPLENHVFTVKAKNDAQYADQNFSNKLMGMQGMLEVSNAGGPSIPGPSPL